ncbi:MAG: heavy-metal-associated domain-containing protein [Actinomycetota bacterium]|nr:heavy-metal-associated domain-containing protein [Actinomycetota bacterium]
MRELTLQIDGMSCGHCLNAVSGALTALPGLEVGSVRIGRAELRYDPAVIAPGQVVAAVRGAGYEAVAVKQ